MSDADLELDQLAEDIGEAIDALTAERDHYRNALIDIINRNGPWSYDVAVDLARAALNPPKP